MKHMYETLKHMNFILFLCMNPIWLIIFLCMNVKTYGHCRDQKQSEVHMYEPKRSSEGYSEGCLEEKDFNFGSRNHL